MLVIELSKYYSNHAKYLTNKIKKHNIKIE